MRLLVLLFLDFMPMFLCAQNYIEVGYTPSRTFLDKDRNNCGSGDLWQLKGMYSHTFSTKVNESGQPIVWAGTINGMYAKMNNKGYAVEYNPEQILNLGLNLTYIRPLTKKNPKWYMMASIGAGIYAAPDDVAWRSILVNGGVVFVYRLARGLDVGVGAGLTTSFGVPLVMPMTFVKWTSTGQYEIMIEAMSNIRASVARRFGDRFRLELMPCDMDGMSSVFRQDGKSKLYSVMRMRAYIHPELKVGKRSSVYLNAEVNVLSSLAYQDAAKANLFAKELSSVYRYLLTPQELMKVPLQDELDFVKSYIYLEQIRFGASLHINLTYDEQALSKSIVPASIQMLVENALKHNINTRESPLVIDIRINGENVTVTNNLQLRSSVSKNHKGLDNLEKQYRIHGKHIEVMKSDFRFTVV